MNIKLIFYIEKEVLKITGTKMMNSDAKISFGIDSILKSKKVSFYFSTLNLDLNWDFEEIENDENISKEGNSSNSETSEVEEMTREEKPELNPLRLQAIAAQLNQINPLYQRYISPK